MRGGGYMGGRWFILTDIKKDYSGSPMRDHLSFQTIFLEIFPSTYQINTWPTLNLGPSWLQTTDAGWHDDVESVQMFASACIICLFHQYSYKITSSFFLTANLNSGCSCLFALYKAERLASFVLYKRKAEKDW